MTVNFTITGQKQLNARLAAIGKAPREMLREVGVRGVNEAQHLVPHKTGNLRRTVRLGPLTATSVEVRAGGQSEVGYAAAVEFGTKAHPIFPRTQSVRYAGPFLRGQKGQRRGGVLAWGGPRTLGGGLRKGGKPTHFARSVKHPGTRAQPYLIPGLEKALKLVGLDGIVKRWNSGA